MKFNVKALGVIVVCCGILVSANAQINLMSNEINFRDYNSAAYSTIHYGSLRLDGGSEGTNSGLLTCNGVSVFGQMSCMGNLNVYGSTKNFIQPHPTDTTKVVKYIAIEAGEALTLARGTAKTQSSVVSIDLPEHFTLVTSDEAPLTVLITPENAPVLLYTTKKNKSQIVVNMKQSDYAQYGDAEFSWQVTGVRDGFENEKAIVDLDSAGNVESNNSVVSPKRAAINERVKKLMEKQQAARLKKKGK